MVQKQLIEFIKTNLQTRINAVASIKFHAIWEEFHSNTYFLIDKMTKIIVTDNLVLTTELKTYIDHRKEFKG